MLETAILAIQVKKVLCVLLEMQAPMEILEPTELVLVQVVQEIQVKQELME